MSQPAGADSNSALSNSVGNFAELVAAGTPAPGGGSVSAHSGMLAASLGQMVCNLSIGKPKFAAVEARLTEIRSSLEGLGARLRELIAEDASSFDGVLQSYRLPKETEEQKAERSAQIQSALRHAVAVPMQTAERSVDVLTLLRELADIGNPNTLSDVAVGAQLAQTATRGASYNVGANLGTISDNQFVESTKARIKSLLELAEKLAEEVETKVEV